MGRRAGNNAARMIDGRRPKQFKAKEGPLLLTFGDLATFLVLDDGRVVENDSLAAGRELVFQRTMAEIARPSAKGSAERRSRRIGVLGESDVLDLLSPGGLLLSLARTRIRA